MPLQPNKRKAEQLAAVQDGIGKKRKASRPREERLKEVPTEDSSPIDAMVVPDTITSFPTIHTSLPDVAMSLPPTDVDVNDDADADANTDPRTTDRLHLRRELSLSL